VDVAIRLQLPELGFYYCSLTPAHLPAFTRLLTGCRALESFVVHNGGVRLISGDGVPAFMRLWEPLQASIAVLDAITGHHSLSRVIFRNPAWPADGYRVAAGASRFG
jgi:hypothetical protein